MPPQPIVFLQHPGERRNPIGTMRMLQLQLVGSRVLEGVDFTEQLRHIDKGAVLFPSPGAKDLSELQGDETLIVIDGTWSQAKKVWKTNPLLQAMPAYRLNPTAPGRYRIRKEPAEHCLSTIEATAQMLEAITGRDHSMLLQPFDHMVEKQLGFIAEGGGRVRKKLKRKERSVKLPPLDQVVLVYADPPMNAWTAYRPTTGETLAVPLPARQQMQEFAKPGDVWCSWGPHAINIYGEGAGKLYDLKDALTDYHKRRLGYLEDAVARLGLKSEPLGVPDRPGRRLSALATLFLHARTHCVTRAHS